MVNRRPNSTKPRFFWQGVLILLPVTVLAVVSLISLRLDQRSAERDARNRVAEGTESLTRAMRSTVNEELQRYLTLQHDWLATPFGRTMAVYGTKLPLAVPQLPLDIQKWEKDYPDLKLADVGMPRAVISKDGRPLEPMEIPAAPTPPPWYLDLSPKQRELWQILRQTEPTNVAAIKIVEDAFLATHPSTEARQIMSQLLQPLEFQIRDDSFTLPSETGIPFQDLACYQLLSGKARQSPIYWPSPFRLADVVWYRVIQRPSFIAPQLLTLAESYTNGIGIGGLEDTRLMRKIWDRQEKIRSWLPTLSQPSGSPSNWVHWTSGASAEALAFFLPPPPAPAPGEVPKVTSSYSQQGHISNLEVSATLPVPPELGYTIGFVPRPVLRAIFARALAENKFLLPDYARSFFLTVENVPVAVPGGADSFVNVPLLGDATQPFGIFGEHDAGRFELKVFLTSRDRMLAVQQRRSSLFGLLIVGALFAALVGWLGAWRAFQRQLQLNEMKSNFVSSVSHELRAPIASVRLMAENLEHDKIPDVKRQHDYFRFIAQECRRLSALIENVLDFSRIEQGRKQYEFEPTNLSLLTRETVQLMSPYAAEKGVLLQSEAGEAVEMIADGRALQQALVNLIDNAVKHSARGESVTVGLETIGAVIQLSVADHGPGIPATDHERIFERFYRRGSELHRETQGVGIGLSLVKHIVEAHGGRVRVQSKPGQGSRFTIELPVKG